MKRLFFSSLFVNIFVRFLNVWTGVLGARLLGPYGRGDLAAANKWSSLFVLLFTIGLPGAVIFYGKRDRENQAQYVGAYLVLGACVGLIGCVVGETIMPYLFSKQSEHLVHLAMIAMISVPFGVVADGLIGTLLTVNKFAKVLSIRVLGEVGTLVLIVGLIIARRYDVTTFLVGNLVWSILTFSITLFLVLRVVTPSFANLIHNMRLLLIKGFHIYSTALVSMFGANIDQLTISLFLTPYTLGLYSVSTTIGGVIPALIGGALSNYLWPKLMDCSEGERREKVARIHGVLFYGTLVMSVLAAFIVPILLPIVYGSDFRSAILMTEILLLSTPINVGYLVISYFFSTSNKFNSITIAEGIGLACGLFVTFPLIHLWEGVGAALGVYVAVLSKWVFVIVVTRKLLPFSSLMRLYVSSFSSLYKQGLRLVTRSSVAAVD